MLGDVCDKAEAMRAYARQPSDRELRFWAAETKLRTERRAGALLTEMRLSPGRPQETSQHATICVPFPTVPRRFAGAIC